MGRETDPDDRMHATSLSERDNCTKFITPASCQAGWDEVQQIRGEVYFTKERIIVRAIWSRERKGTTRAVESSSRQCIRRN